LGIPANLPKSTLIFQFGSIFGPIREMYVPAMPANFPSPPWETHNCSLFAGRWCLYCFWQCHDNVFLDSREFSLLCACSSSKVPIAPMGDSPFARCLQGGGVYVGGGTVAISSCTISENTAMGVRAHAQNFPSPRWDTHVLLVVCRAAVSPSGEARCQS
jgi:hypothetical protein